MSKGQKSKFLYIKSDTINKRTDASGITFPIHQSFYKVYISYTTKPTALQ